MGYPEEEVFVAKRAIEEYRKHLDQIKKEEEFLKDKKFPMGTLVQLNDFNIFCKRENCGKVIGWDFDYNYYRIYLSPEFPFLGAKESNLEFYEGESVPEDVKVHDRFQIKSLYLNLKGEKKYV